MTAPSPPRRPFYFLRHGESQTNRAGLIAGWLNVPLTEAGHAQAQAAAQVLDAVPLATILASPLARALDTAHPIATRQTLPITTLDGLKERGWGDLEGKPLAQRQDPFSAAPGGESWETFRARVLDSLSVLGCFPDPVLIVGHSGTMRVLRAVLGRDPSGSRTANALPWRLAPPPPDADPAAPWSVTPLLAPEAFAILTADVLAGRTPSSTAKPPGSPPTPAPAPAPNGLSGGRAEG